MTLSNERRPGPPRRGALRHERPERTRRVQSRAVATRAALLDAALECLVERGWAATTTTEVAERAGVSRGGQLHHFHTKAELLTAAVDHLLERRTAEFRAAFAGLRPETVRVEDAVGLLWSMFDGPTFVAYAELWLAARTDPELRRAVVAMDERFIAESAAIFGELFPPGAGGSDDFHQTGLAFAFAVMEGLAFQRMVPHAAQLPAERVVAALADVARTMAPEELGVPAVPAIPVGEPQAPRPSTVRARATSPERAPAIEEVR